MTLKYGNKSVPFGAIVTHGENKNGSIVAENGQVYLTGLPQSGQLQKSVNPGLVRASATFTLEFQ
ncbi:TPA: FimD/PapC C-terminal domain-containing protein [Escherichia coli]